ncbi:restriction endonuclease subunit S [Cryobacterium sp. 10I1]|uniref:restriction endonuclease subunit S n=1 Tax=unclassified Cryobacterium TaxID=2649013 RepID=UPI002AC9172B|nr:MULTISPECIES: restriction endonuclease subunit S [unclassified Cryobacterium]MEB0286778.1 restriction endonuclease subunit S [Cryobacterium sp. 10S3]MEB0303749.1 restriction endonuclease subunit S [Cryobacterium sp. 10I1]WPX12672.1 restriction endonuclease subunit S [Cryobacterium sp. 10S3]
MTKEIVFNELLDYPLRSGVTVAAASRGSGIKMLNMGELFRFPRIPNVEMARVNLTGFNAQRSLLKRHDLMFARRSLTLEGAGKCSIVEQVHEPTTWESSIIRARLDPSIADARFYFYYFNSPSGRRQMETIVEQVAAAGIRLTELGKLTVPFPTLHAQRAIADVLGAIDDKVTSNSSVGDAAFSLAGALYDQAVAGVPVRAMGQVLNPILGGTPARANLEFWEGSHFWASAKDVTGASCGVIIDTDERISDSAITTTKAKPLPAGSVILTARGTVGAVARLAKPSSFNQSCYGFAPGRLPAGVLYFSILRATARAKAFAHGSVFDTITMKTFDHLHLPDLDAAGASRIEAVVTPLLDSVTAAVIQNSVLVATRDALLPQFMSGKLRVRDAEKVLEGVL